jgi:hypothetical protein
MNVSALTSRGSEASLVDVSQQLAWLGASCGRHSSPTQGGLTYCDTMWEQDPYWPNSFRITYKAVSFDNDSNPPPWNSLLGKISFATGFNVASLEDDEFGLVVPAALFTEGDEAPSGAEGASQLSLVSDNASTERLRMLTSGIPSD